LHDQLDVVCEMKLRHNSVVGSGIVKREGTEFSGDTNIEKGWIYTVRKLIHREYIEKTKENE